ncbi:MAG: flagellar protein FlgN [Clostridia bacterium]|nr:flagellar protein FlgN [Clostridia bacterium]
MTPLESLRGALDEELALYRDLYALGVQKGRAIEAADVQALARVVEGELECLARLERAEARRAKASAELAASLGAAAEATLHEILRLLPQEEREALKERRFALLSVMDEVRRVSGANEELLRQSLAYVNFSLGLIQRAQAAADVYDRDGRRPARPAAAWQRRA